MWVDKTRAQRKNWHLHGKTLTRLLTDEQKAYWRMHTRKAPKMTDLEAVPGVEMKITIGARWSDDQWQAEMDAQIVRDRARLDSHQSAMSGYAWLVSGDGLESLRVGALGTELRKTIAREVGKPLPLGNRSEMQNAHAITLAQELDGPGINPQAQATVASKVAGGMSQNQARTPHVGGEANGTCDATDRLPRPTWRTTCRTPPMEAS
jgi:hypothetical protein